MRPEWELHGWEHVLLSQNPKDNQQPSVTQAPENLISSSDFWGLQAHMWEIHICAGKALKVKIIIKKNKKTLHNKKMCITIWPF